MNDENLIPFNERSAEDRRRIAQMGGLAAGKKRRRARNLRELANMLLEADLDLDLDGDIAERLAALDLAPDQQGAVLLACLDKAKAGDAEHVRLLRDTAGQAPAQAVDIKATDGAEGLRNLSTDQIRELLRQEKSAADHN